VPDLSAVVAQTLHRASEDTQKALSMLARTRGSAEKAVLPSPDAALMREVSISWTGPADTALRELALKAGYSFVENGKRRAEAPPVTVNASSKSIYSLFEDIAWQVQPLCVLQINTQARTISLSGSGSLAPPSLGDKARAALKKKTGGK
jgi:hypothetical protein